MRASRGLLGVTLAGACLLFAVPARRVEALAGIGRAAVEAANGTVPESVDALEEQIRELEATETHGGTPSNERSYRLAILRLNRPKGYGIDDQRALLAHVIANDPGYKDALQIWIDLVPAEMELHEMELALAKLPPIAPVAWAQANVLHLEAKFDESNRAAEEAEQLDAAYRGRVRWLRAQVAGERKDDAAATRLLGEALDSLDDSLEPLLWENALLVASPEEIERYKSALSEDRKDFYRSFWKRRDVFPLTETNERLGEHFRRIAKARHDYVLRGNGYGYLTTHDLFKKLSPDLPFYSSDVVYDYQERIALWVDHRGLIYIRHGEPDRSTRSTDGVRSETWLYYRYSARPLMFHLIDRRGVGEFVLTLNLAQALASATLEDDPQQILQNSGDFRDLYSSRSPFHSVFQRIAISRSSYEVQDLLDQEAAMMAGFIREAWVDDTNSLIKADDLLPFAFHNANFRATKTGVDAYFYYAVPERELKADPKSKTPPDAKLTFDATIVLYDDKWKSRVASAEDHLTATRTPGRKPGKKDLLRGKLVIPDLPPGRYNYAFQVTERSTGKIGIAKGRFVADYFGPEFVDMSDLLLAVDPQAVPGGEQHGDAVYATFERGNTRLTPEPTRTLERGKLGKIYFELYDLKPGADGESHYRVEYRVLQVQQKPSVISQILGFTMNIAGAFFPYEVFLAQAGLFGLDVVTSNPTKGLDTEVQERQTPLTAAPVTEVYRIVDKKYPPGIYQVYVTVKDYVSGSIATRSVRFAVD